MTRNPDSVLEIDLDAIAGNWKKLHARLKRGADAAAIVKADAYGLGVAAVAPKLWAAGCRLFFIADLDEGLALRRLLPRARIGVLNGYLGEAALFTRAKLMPVLNDLGQVAAWAEATRRAPAMLHLDTGLTRLGLPEAETQRLAADPALLGRLQLAAIVSHLACADMPDSPLNRRQLDAFRILLKSLPRAPASLASSSGIYLGTAYHFDFVRPGAALYGVNPLPNHRNPMAQAIMLKGKILQIRDADKGAVVGYDATFRMKRAGRLAVIGAGYADGWFRAASGRASVGIGGHRAPVVGRVSMDVMTVDVTEIPPALVRTGDYADLLDDDYGVDRFAADAGTIGYEVLTALGGRHHRIYRGAAH